MSNTNKQEQHLQNYHQLIQQQKTLLLATVSEQGEPECSYAPYVRDQQGVFYIYVSDLAVHAKNMMHNQKVSILFIRSETETQNLFARERAVFNCSVREIQKTDECFDKQLQQMKQQFGETVDLLRSLSDFHLLALTSVDGKYIAGFGQAYQVNMLDDSLNLG